LVQHAFISLVLFSGKKNHPTFDPRRKACPPSPQRPPKTRKKKKREKKKKKENTQTTQQVLHNVDFIVTHLCKSFSSFPLVGGKKL
jgi:hypothetical protein